MANASQLTSDFKGDHLSVKMFGAVADGVTNNAAAIQEAMDYLDSRGGGHLFFPDTDVFKASGLTLRSNVHLYGTATIDLIDDDSAAGQTLYGNGISGFSIEG